MLTDRYLNEMLPSFACQPSGHPTPTSLNDLCVDTTRVGDYAGFELRGGRSRPEPEAKLTVNVPRTSVLAPSNITRRRILPMKISLYSFSNP